MYIELKMKGKSPVNKLICELTIVPHQIFFLEKQVEDSEVETIVRMLHNCDERSMQIIKVTIRAAMES
ncbi:hypothetical protein B5F98_01660 [Pseudoflavonifractor sp. An44]|nr:hypothetical protein B5F98_01660 [Pseudoflavonifractor sp. An44]